jgi:hypothetical protein
MISFKTSSFPVKRKLILFAPEPSLRHGLFDSYMQSFCKEVRFGFKRIPKYTKIIDITSDQFTESFCKSCMKKINKAKAEGVLCETTTDINGFITLFNDFAKRKHFFSVIREKELEIFGDALVIRTARLKNGTNIVYHSYLLDKSIKSVRVLNSVSVIHDDQISPADRALTGFANRCLHYEDMLYFRDQGFVTYDMGGYAFNTQDKSLQGINEFKDSFGGELIEESNYESYMVYMLKVIKNRLMHKKTH